MRPAIGVDLGGTKLAAGLVDPSGVISARYVVPTPRGEGALVDAVRAAVEALGPSEVAGLGIGAAGLIDHQRGRYLFGPNLDLGPMDMASVLSAALGMTVRVDNDANCAAWAEHRFGAGRGARHFICVTLGTGIGGGIVIDGRPYRGANGGAAEIGHVPMDPSGPPCGCGRRGCWEQMASGQALERLARERMAGGRCDPAGLTGPAVSRAAREGDRVAREVVETVAAWIGWGLAALVNVFEPEVIAIAGGMAADWDLYATVAEGAMLEAMEASEHRPAPRLVAAQLGPDAGIVGAAALLFGS
ncbi:MAG TPA: ROK family protein [Actinomycetota bacterium]|nr:ROK family protein [Actinomycetota bacterium]